MKNNNLILAFGQICLIFGINCFLINTYFIKYSSLTAFIAGSLLGLSLVLNLTYMIRRNKSDR